MGREKITDEQWERLVEMRKRQTYTCPKCGWGVKIYYDDGRECPNCRTWVLSKRGKLKAFKRQLQGKGVNICTSSLNSNRGNLITTTKGL